MNNKMTLFLPMLMILSFAGCLPDQPTPLTPPPDFTPHSPLSGQKESMTAAAFPDMPSLDVTVYSNIKETCRERWQIEMMKMDTFKVVPDRDAYLVECEGVEDGELYSCTIRVDRNGKWINDGRIKKTP